MRLLRLLVKLVIAILLGAACAVVPLAQWVPEWVVTAQLPVAAMLVVMYCGKLLFDTLFYDHFRP